MTHALKAWADWYVSCAGGNVPHEAQAAYDTIDEIARLRAELSEAKESLRLAVKSADLADAAIATARADALEEAAELARKLSCKSAAAAIRALIDKDQPK